MIFACFRRPRDCCKSPRLCGKTRRNPCLFRLSTKILCSPRALPPAYLQYISISLCGRCCLTKLLSACSSRVTLQYIRGSFLVLSTSEPTTLNVEPSRTFFFCLTVVLFCWVRCIWRSLRGPRGPPGKPPPGNPPGPPPGPPGCAKRRVDVMVKTIKATIRLIDFVCMCIILLVPKRDKLFFSISNSPFLAKHLKINFCSLNHLNT